MPAPPVLSAEVLLKEKRVESARLEFKSTWDDQTRPAILRTVCAFANDLDNLNGGYIVIGVEDDRGQAILPPRGIAGNKVEDVSKELQGLAALRALIPTLVRKNDKRAEADRSAAWPFPAVEEALVNAIHHRGYDPANPDPIKVVLYPDRMVITSYPGPMPGITKEQLARGEVAHVRARNRHISELLKDVRLAEARGSGIGKIRRSMERAGNPPPRFEFDEPERTFFEVTLPIHPAHLPEAQALPLRVGTPALAGELVGRQSLLEEIRSELRHHHIALLGPKGRGITSLLNELEANLPEYECHRLNLASVDPRRITGFIEALAHEAFTTPALLLDDVRAETMTSLAPVFSKHPALRVIAAPSDVPDEDGEWWQHFQPLVVPPLDAADARSLAGRLLAGQGVAATTGLADAIAEAAAGLPGIIHRIVQRVSINQALRAPEHIPEVLEELVATRGDPTKLRQRCEAIIGVQSRALDVMADATDTLSPDDLRVALSEWMTPVEARAQLLRLIEAGWLVIRDGPVAFEHPLIRDAWQKSREVDPLEPGDIPS